VNINATLFGQMITFALLVWFTMKYVWPPLMQALEERRRKIAEGLAAAEKGQHEMELAEKKAVGVIKEAKDQAGEIVTLAQKRAAELAEQSKLTAKQESERIVAAAKGDIEREVQQAKEELRKEVAAIAVSAAEQILKKEVDQDKHRDLIQNLGKKLG